MRFTAPGRRFAGISPDGSTLRSNAWVTCPRGWPRWVQRPPSPAAMPWCRRFRPEGLLLNLGECCAQSTMPRQAPHCGCGFPTAPSQRSAKDGPMAPDNGGEDAARAAHATPISQLGYEKCRDELIEVVRLLEQGGLDLDASLALWERGEQLAKRCEDHLAGARKRVTDALAASEPEDS